MLNVKNQEKAAKAFAKAKKLFISRDDNYYYICDGYKLVKITPETYNDIFIPAAPVYKEIEPGQTIQKEGAAKVAKKLDKYLDLTKVIPQRGESIKKTNYMIDICDVTANIFIKDNTPVYVNAEYYNAVEPFNYTDEWTNDGATTPVYCINDDGTAAVVLPIKAPALDLILTPAADVMDKISNRREFLEKAREYAKEHADELTTADDVKETLNAQIEDLKNIIVSKDETINELRIKINALEYIQEEKEKATPEPVQEETETINAILEAQNEFIQKAAASMAAATVQDEPETTPEPGAIIERYDNNGERIHITHYTNFYAIEYGITYDNARDCFHYSSIARGYKSLEEARAALNNHRPGAIGRKAIALCINCIADCDGTDNESFTGCIYKSPFNNPRNDKPTTTASAPEKVQDDEKIKRAAAAMERSLNRFNKSMDRIKAQRAAGITIKLPKHARTNYDKIKKFIDVVDNNGGACKFFSGDYMPLVIEKLYYCGPFNNPVYSIAHYGTQNGDAMRDPDITFEYVQDCGAIIPLSYQNDYMNYFREVFKLDDDGKPSKYSRHELTGIDEFMYTWLNNIKSQGFTPEARESIA